MQIRLRRHLNRPAFGFIAAMSIAAFLLQAGLLHLGRADAAEDTPSASGVHDNGKIFSAEAIGKADEAIRQIHDRHHRDLRVETYAQLPDDQRAAFDRLGKARFYPEWAANRAKDAGVNGVLVLICMSPGHVEVAATGPGVEKVFGARDRDELSPALGKVLGEKQYDDALARTVTFVQKRMDANDPHPAEAAPVKPAAQAERGGMALVDMDRVARIVGWQEAINTQSKAVEKDLLEQLNIYQSSLDRALVEREKSLADEANLSADQSARLQRAQTINDLERVALPRDQREELLRNVTEVNQARQTAQNHSRELFEKYQASLLDSYRQAIKPAVSRVAFDEGYALVTVPQATLIYVDPSADITDKVAQALKKDMPEPKQPGKPTLDLEPFKLSPLTRPETRPGG